MPMATAELSRRAGKGRRLPAPVCELSAAQLARAHEALLAACCFEDLPGGWQAGVLDEVAERFRTERPKAE
jgi:hypothetical protein